MLNPGCYNYPTSTQPLQQQTPLTPPVFDYRLFNGSVLSAPRPIVPYPVPMSQQQQDVPSEYSTSPTYSSYSQPQQTRPQYPQGFNNKAYPVPPPSTIEGGNSLDVSMGSLVTPSLSFLTPYGNGRNDLRLPNMHSVSPLSHLQFTDSNMSNQQVPYNNNTFAPASGIMVGLRVSVSSQYQ